MKKVVALVLVLVLALSLFAGCGAKEEEKVIRYLNFKPESAEVYAKIADDYFAETGVKLIVETAASGTYESTLQARVATNESPTLFQINGPVGYKNWKDYTADLSNTELYKHLSDKSLAISDKNGVYGIPYVVEAYGIIYNQAIMNKYFALDKKATTYKSMSEINNYAKLKEVVEDMQKNKEALGIKGVFASTSLKPGEDWRWQTHLANVPVYYEFTKGNVDLTSDAVKNVKFTYSQNYKNIFDLYIENSTTAKTALGTKTVDESMAEFALGECAMVQNGNWGAGQILGVKGNTVESSDIKFMPIYTGVDGEEKQGLCTGTENFICINKTRSDAEQKLAADFLYWLYSSEKGKKYVTNELGFIAPFDTFKTADLPSNPLAQEVGAWMANGSTSVAWNFTLFPSQNFKDQFGANLLKYAQGSMTWDEVSAKFVSDWASEYKLVG